MPPLARKTPVPLPDNGKPVAHPQANGAPVPERIAPSLRRMLVPLASLKLDPRNARLHPEKSLTAIKASLSSFGQLKPIVVRKQTMTVVAGNGTVEAARALGWNRIAANVVEMTEIEAIGYGLADNKVAECSEWDDKVVAELDQILREAGAEPVGWSLEELTAIRMGLLPRKADPDDIPEPPIVPISKLGDAWTMGPHRLSCGDSTDSKAVANLMGKKKATLMVTDPPYGLSFKGQKYNPTAKNWDGIKGDSVQGANLQEFINRLLITWFQVMEDQAAYYLWTAAMAEGFAALEGIKESGLHVQSQIIWHKHLSGLSLGQSDYQWKHENCWYAFRKGVKHRWFGGRNKTTVWDVKKVNSVDYLHPMQKPTELYEIPIENHTTVGEVIAEPFAGSGTQFIAAQKLGRVCYGMELDPVYVDVALQRYLDFTGDDPVRESDGASFSELKKNRPGS